MSALAVYGSLAPGQANEHVLASIEGTWTTGQIRGHRFESDWGTNAAYPRFIPDDTAEPVSVQILTSPQLADEWERLDAFEGGTYRRQIVTIETESGPVDANAYTTIVDERTTFCLHGSLMPDGNAHYTVSHLLPKTADGHWFDAAVRGYEYEITWGPAEGLTGVTAHPDGNLVPVAALFAARFDEPAWRWDRVDDAIGAGFNRNTAALLTRSGNPIGRTTIHLAETTND